MTIYYLTREGEIPDFLEKSGILILAFLQKIRNLITSSCSHYLLEELIAAKLGKLNGRYDL